jgi:50S ribosomal protein L16 3-hydroxylase
MKATSPQAGQAGVLTHLGSRSVAQFLREDWQRRPRLLRQALPGLRSPLAWPALAALAARDDVESRLITCIDGHWRLRHGPLPARALPSRRTSGWTLLVQGTDTLDAAAARLLARFRFIADARLDDLMVSYASDGGGVGPHVDSYDVFLIQAQGRRRWQISRQRKLTLRDDVPLKMLADFRPQQEWVLEPGDVLYLPPGVAHEGTAVGGDCITCSVGFRAPRWAEAAEPWLDSLLATPALQAQWRDPGLRPTRHPAALPSAMTDAFWQALIRAQPTRTAAARALLIHQTEPKPHVVFAPPTRALTRDAFERAAARRGLALDLRTRVLYSGAELAINGEAVAAPGGRAPALRRLADARALGAADCASLEPVVRELLFDWYVAGWLHLQAT